MEIHRGRTTAVQIGFVAPIPAGHEVIVISFEREGAGWLEASEAEAVVDVTSGTIYADLTYWSAMKAHRFPDASPASDPAGALGPAWRAKHSFHGRATGAVVSTRDTGDTNHACTILFLVPLDVTPGYRG